MYNYRKLIHAVEVILLLFCLSSRIHASLSNVKSKASAQSEVLSEHPSNKISDKEENVKLESEQLYYMPMQTVFGVTEVLTAVGDLSTTSPPHLNISPSPMQATFQQSTSTFFKESIDERDSNSYPNECVSETPMNELESQFLVPSKDLTQESVIMSGHLEIASRTSSMDKMSEINNFVSQPSIALQGTILHSYSSSDL